ncbi:MAG TPA: CBS domain-containing protein, partial [Saprospiraceae bacterium]|nr:CBS domain-containing protein [Saprospiraceae bacterium]
KVEEFMETDLFTVQKDDIVELVAEMMDWRKIRYMPVEDKKGNLIGLVTSRLLLRHFSNRKVDKKKDVIIVNDIMIKDPITISPDATVLDALEVMRNKQIGCLPVVDKNELVGIITETDFLRITGRLIDRMEHVEEDGE